MGPDHTPKKIAMPMTAASVAQRRMGFKALRAQKMVSRPAWFPKDSAGGESRIEVEERGHPPLDSEGGVYGHSDGRSPEDGREQASEGRSWTKQALKTHQERAQGDDQVPLAAIARVSAAKCETWILVLCLRM